MLDAFSHARRVLGGLALDPLAGGRSAAAKPQKGANLFQREPELLGALDESIEFVASEETVGLGQGASSPASRSMILRRALVFRQTMPMRRDGGGAAKGT